MPENPSLPWIYSYREDGRSTRLGQPILRPIVPVSLVHRDQSVGRLVLLGSVGFLDQFTVTTSRFAQAIAVEDRDTLDERFGTILSA